jgi:molybdate transport system regulatory protein
MARLKLKLQVMCGDEIALGPGKADLLEAIAAHGSIAAAGRAMSMSYRRAWLLVDAMNRCWTEPLVATSPSGAELTPLGGEVLEAYRALATAAEKSARGASWAILEAALRPEPQPAQER